MVPQCSSLHRVYDGGVQFLSVALHMLMIVSEEKANITFYHCWVADVIKK